MPKLVILITSQIDKGLEVAEKWATTGAPGVTLVDSYGLHRLREQSRALEIPLFVSMASLMHQIEETSQIILSVVGDDLVDRLLDAACDILGSLDRPNTGIAFVIDVERTVGMRRHGPPPD